VLGRRTLIRHAKKVDATSAAIDRREFAIRRASTANPEEPHPAAHDREVVDEPGPALLVGEGSVRE
jgi:hypothetical protein